MAFEEFDINSDGRICEEGIEAMADKMGVKFTKADIRKIIEDVSQGKAETISWDEFLIVALE